MTKLRVQIRRCLI